MHTRALLYRVSLLPQFQPGQLATVVVGKATVVAHSVADMAVNAPDGSTLIIKPIFTNPK